jgi:hypothetical protein
MSSAKIMHRLDDSQNVESGIKGLTQKQSKEVKNDLSFDNLKKVQMAKRKTSRLLARKMTFIEVWNLTMRTYNRTVGNVYSDSPYLPRPLKVLGSVAQFYIILIFTGLFAV